MLFTTLHGMQTRSSDKNSVCPSVCLAVRLSNASIVKKTEEKSVQIFIPYKRSFSLVF